MHFKTTTPLGSKNMGQVYLNVRNAVMLECMGFFSFSRYRDLGYIDELS